jgi:hypothetical protein
VQRIPRQACHPFGQCNLTYVILYFVPHIIHRQFLFSSPLLLSFCCCREVREMEQYVLLFY